VAVLLYSRFFEAYLCGGKDHLAADREVGEKILQTSPDLVSMNRANRAFLGRVVRFLAPRRGSAVPGYRYRHSGGGQHP
jgi:hypothetical protein